MLQPRLRSLSLSALSAASQCRQQILRAVSVKSAVCSQYEQQQHRLRLFNAELERQKEISSKSIKNIQVKYCNAQGQQQFTSLPAGIATPVDVASLVSEESKRDSVLALVDGSQWDMHRPLTDDCTIQFLEFKRPSNNDDHSAIHACNNALFRSSSVILGAVLETAFKESYQVKLLSFPPPMPKSGSFVYDCQVTKPRQAHSILELSDKVNWQPTATELRVLSFTAHQFLKADHIFQPLEIFASLAVEMFKHNDHKVAAVQQILKSGNKESLGVYRVGSFVEISKGPMLANTSLIGRYLVTAVHQLDAIEFGHLFRVQGLAIPRAFLDDFHSLDALLQRASSLNFAFLPQCHSNSESTASVA